MTAPQRGAWVGVDIGKAHHWVCVLDADGDKLLSVKVANDEAEIVEVIATVRAMAARAVWAVDIIGAPSALMLARCWRKLASRCGMRQGGWSQR